MNPGYPPYPGYYPPPQPPRVSPEPPLPQSLRVTKIALGIAIPLFWFIALALPAYNDDIYGALCAAMGWSMLFTGNIYAFFAWCSNLPFWVSYFLFVIGNRRATKIAALITAACSLLLAFGALTVSKVAESESGMNMRPANANYGLFIWLAAYVLVISGSMAYVVLLQKQQDISAESLPQTPLYPPVQHPSQYPPQYPPSEYQSPYPPADPYAQQPPLPEQGYNPWENNA